MNIALARSDNMGDLLFSLPLAASLKKHIPNAKITLIAREYVKDIADASPYIDHFLSHEYLLKMEVSDAADYLNKHQIDSILILKGNETILQLAKKAKIPHIVSHLKNYFWYVLSLNPFKFKIVNTNFKSKKGTLHFAQKCLKFLHFYNIDSMLKRSDLSAYLKLNVRNSPKVLKLLEQKKFNLVIHLGTNGNTSEWPLDQFNLLIKQLPKNVNILLTGSLEEKKKFSMILQSHTKVTDLFGKLNGAELLCLLKNADGLIANATGPLHLAAALNTKVLGLYPSRPTVNTERWGPLGKSVGTISAPICALSEKNKKCDCMKKITVEEVLNYIQKNWLEIKKI
jgi:ADP-heptose:LPS heptosyltransferase